MDEPKIISAPSRGEEVSYTDIFAARPVDIPAVTVLDKFRKEVNLEAIRQLFTKSEDETERSSSAAMAGASVNALRLPEGFHFDRNFVGASGWVMNWEVLEKGGWLVLENLSMADGGLVTTKLPPLAVTPEHLEEIKGRGLFHIALGNNPITGKQMFMLDGKELEPAMEWTEGGAPVSMVCHRILMTKE